jgi:hypothetical protein
VTEREKPAKFRALAARRFGIDVALPAGDRTAEWEAQDA